MLSCGSGLIHNNFLQSPLWLVKGTAGVDKFYRGGISVKFDSL